MRRHTTLFAVAVAVLALAAGGLAGVAAADGDATNGATLNGTVASGAQDGTITTDASVVLKQDGSVVDSTFVESDGTFTFHGLADGSYTLVVDAPNHRESTASVSVSGDTDAGTVTLDGAVLNTDTGQSWTAVQPAVTAAATGETVTVAPGTYAESVTVATDGLTLRSTDGAARTTITAASGSAIEINGDNGGSTGVVLDGFTFEGSASNVLNTYNMADITVRNSVVDSSAAGGSGSGMFTDGTATVDNVEFRDTDNFGAGLLVDGAAAGTTVTDSEFSGYDRGLRIENSPDALVSGVVATSNDINGILLRNASGSTLRAVDISSTYIDDGGSGKGRAFQIFNSENILITKAQVGPSNSDAGGILADDGGTYDLSTITIEQSNFVTNGFGLYTSASSGTLNNNVDATGNYFSGNSGGDTCCQIDASSKAGSSFAAGRDAQTDLSGTVSSGATDASVGGGVPVRLEQDGALIESVRTEADGSYTFRNVSGGSYTVVANASGHHAANTTVSVADGDATADLTLPGGVANARSGQTFTSIQSAIDAGTYDVQAGDTIEVAPGTYAESVNFASVSTAPDLTIVSTGAATETTVAGQGATPTFNVNVTGVTVEGLTLTADNAALGPVNSFDTNAITVRESILRATGGQIGINTGETLTAVDNEILGDSDEASGIKLYDTGGTGSTIVENEVTGFGNATAVVNATDLTITNNEFVGNGDQLGEDAINVDLTGSTPDLSTITVAQNNIVGNDFGLSVNRSATGEVDAENNWWGNASGPSAPDANGVSGPVDVEPWLDAPVPAGQSVPTELSATVNTPSSVDANATATYAVNLTVDQAGSETGAFVSLDFGTDTVDLSNVSTANVTIAGPEGAVAVESVLTANSGQTLVLDLASGSVLDDPSAGDTYDITVANVTNGFGGAYTLTSGLHESGTAIAGAAAPAYATAGGSYTLVTTKPLITASGGTVTRGENVTVDLSIDNSQTLKLDGIPANWSVVDRQDDGAFTGSQTTAGWVWTADGTHSVSVTLSVPGDMPTGDVTLDAITESASGVTNETTATVTVERPPDTTAPTAAVGSDVIVASGTAVSFDASGSTDNVGITSYQWDFGDGSTARDPTPTHTYDSAGTYTATVTVSDAAGNTDTATRTVTVDGQAPSAAVGSDRTVTTGETVSFDASGSTDDTGVESYQWSFGDSTGGFGATPTHTYDSAGTYTATVTVSDAAGNTATADVTVTVERPPDTTAPTADAGPDRTVEVGEDLRFDAGASTDNRGIASYQWDFGDGSSATGVRPRNVYRSAGTYTVTLTVTDQAGNTATDTLTVTAVEADSTPPEAEVGQNISTAPGQVLVFDASASTDNRGIASYQWDFGDGSSATGVTAPHSYDEAGTYTVTLTVTDTNGNTDTDTLTATVRERQDTRSPTARAGPDRTVEVGESVAFDARTSTDDTGIASYQWDFGDGTTASGATPSHAYDTPGTYTVALTVTDTAGNTDTDTLTVTVEPDGETSADLLVRPAETRLDAGENTTVTLALANASAGVGAYDLSVNVSAGATITNVSGVDNATLGPDNASVALSGSLGVAADNATLATLTLEAGAPGPLTVSLAGDVATTAGAPYDALSVSNATLQVAGAGPPALPGASGPPTSLDDDEQLEDVDGDGDGDVFDAIAYYNNRNSDTVRNNPDAFDFDGQAPAGTVFDALALFNELSD